MTRRRRKLLGLGVVGTAALALTGAPAASATTTIGQTAPSSPGNCAGATADFTQPTVTSGNSYVVPPGGEKITSWSILAPVGGGQIITMKVFRQVSGLTYQTVGHEGPRALLESSLNVFGGLNVAVQPGDVLGLSKATGSATTCTFPAPGESGSLFNPGNDIPDGQSGLFQPIGVGFRVNITAEVAIRPSNDFKLGKLTRNKDKGIATLAVDVPGPGTLSLTGKGVKAQRTGGAVTSKAVAAAGTVNLKIRAKGRKKLKLNDKGKVKVNFKVTFTPSSGDIPAGPNTEIKRVKLVKND